MFFFLGVYVSGKFRGLGCWWECCMDVRLLDDFGVWDWGVSGVDVWGLDCFRGCCLVKWVCLR